MEQFLILEPSTTLNRLPAKQPRENKEKRPKTRFVDPYGVKTRIDRFENRTRELYSCLEDRVLIPTQSRTVNREASEYSNSRPYRIVKGYIPLLHPITCQSRTPCFPGRIYATVTGCLLTWRRFAVRVDSRSGLLPEQRHRRSNHCCGTLLTA